MGTLTDWHDALERIEKDRKARKEEYSAWLNRLVAPLDEADMYWAIEHATQGELRKFANDVLHKERDLSLAYNELRSDVIHRVPQHFVAAAVAAGIVEKKDV